MVQLSSHALAYFADGDVGAKVYITGRRIEALEQAAKSHNPSDGGEIIP